MPFVSWITPGMSMLALLVCLRMQIATHQVTEYSYANDVWIPKAPMSTSRFRHEATVSQEAVLVFGGASSSICTADESGGLADCTDRPLSSSEAYYDTKNPDIYIYTRTQ